MASDVSFARRVYESLPDNLRSPYHDPEYVVLDAKEKLDVKATFFIFQCAGETYYHPLHCTHTPHLAVTDFEGARGYGGPISTSNDVQFLKEAFAAYQLFAAEHKVLVEFIRFSPMLDNQHYYYGDAWFDRETCAIKLDDYSLDKNSHGAVSNISKALKNNCRIIITREPSTDQIIAFNRIYNDRMLELNADSQYIYSAEYVDYLVKEKNDLALVEYENEIIAASIFLKSASWFEYHLSAANKEGRRLGVINLILHAYAMQNRAESTILHLGGGTDHRPENNLLKFKQGMGKLKKSFYIGKFVHQPEVYQQIKLKYSDESKRVIFYR